MSDISRVMHGITMNGRIHGELVDRFDPVPLIIFKRLCLLDGTLRYCFSLWRLPEGVQFDCVDLGSWPQEYVQAAGSRDRMTVEVRTREPSGYRQYVIGHPAGDRPHPDTQTVVAWNGCRTTVLRSEVFEVEEAARIFAAYQATGTVSDEYSLRLIEL